MARDNPSELEENWQDNQRLFHDLKEEVSRELRSQISREEEAKWRSQLEQMEATQRQWQKAREERELEVARFKALLSERESDIRRLEKEKIDFEHRTQAEIAAMLAKSREKLHAALTDADRDREQQIRDLKAQWAKEVGELKSSLDRFTQDRQAHEAELTQVFFERRKELETLWRTREEEAWKQMEQVRLQTENALQAQFTARLGALERARAEQQALFEQRLAELEAARAEKEKALEALFREKERVMRERYQSDLQDKEAKLDIRRMELEQRAAKQEADLLARFRREEEALRASLKELESSLRRTANEEMARRKAALKNTESANG